MDKRTYTKLQVQRKKNGLSQQALSNLANVSMSAIAKLEAGGRSPRLANARAIARALGVTVDDLWPEVDE